MLEMVVRLVLVGGVVVGGLLALRHANAKGLTARGGPALRVVGRTGLTRSALVAVVAVDDRRFLVGASDQGIQLLSELDPVLDQDTIDLDELSHQDGHDGLLTTAGPRIGPLDRLREMTVRTPQREPIRAPGPDRR